MKIRFIVVGKKMPAWIQTGYEDYERRLPRELNLELIEIPLTHRSKNADVRRLLKKEGELMLAQTKASDYVISLDVTGQSLSTEKLAVELERWQSLGTDISLLVGGPDGLSEECYQRTQWRWSISPLTLPHPMVRVMIAEALYRAWSINVGHPYHRA